MRRPEPPSERDLRTGRRLGQDAGRRSHLENRFDFAWRRGEELKVLAKELNPVVGFWDPIGLSELDLWDQGEEATIGWLREARL